MKRLLICDFDGTLYRKGEQRQFDRILSLVQQERIPFAVASGRPWHMLRPFFESILDRVFLISNDGALVTRGEQILYANPIDQTKLNQLCLQTSGDFVAYGQLLSYLKISGLADQIRWRKTFRQHTVKINSLEEIIEPIYKIFFMKPVDCPSFLTPTYDQFGVIEFAAKGTDKAAALRWLAEQEGVKLQNCYAFGDGINDVCIFDIVGHSAAMVQSLPKVKHRADKICVNLYEDIATIFQRGDCQ